MSASPTTSITFQNFFSATLTGDITTTSTDILLDTVPNGSEGFLVIEPDSSSNREVIYYNSKTATKVVCPSAADGRGQDDTTAHSHLTGAVVIMAPVAAYFETLLSLFTTSPQGWTSLSGNFTSPAYSGNHSYDITTSVDQTAILSPGMRFRATRTVAAPNKCTDLEAGSSQYYSKTTPTGVTFTDDWTAMGWVKLESYAAGGIIARRNADVEGWSLSVNASGQVLAGSYRIASNNSVTTSYQSLPLNKWVHVAATTDLSGTSVLIYIDGILAPSATVITGTCTALVQGSTALVVGAEKSAGTNPLDGKLAQAAVFSAVLSAATIRSYISQTLSGSETSLVSAYSFNNAITDLNTSNANDLSAQGSALATATDSPYGGQAHGTISTTLEYGIVTKVTASTLTVQVPEGCAIPTTGGVSAASYSTYKAPFGLPTAPNKWRLTSLHKTLDATSSNATYGAFKSGGWSLTVPVGEWNLGWAGDTNSINVVVSWNISPSDLAGLTAITGHDVSPFSCRILSAAAAATVVKSFVQLPRTVTTQAAYVMYSVGATTSAGIDGTLTTAEIFAEFSLL